MTDETPVVSKLDRGVGAVFLAAVLIGFFALAAMTLVMVADIVLRGGARGLSLLRDRPVGAAVPGVVDLVQLFVVASAYLGVAVAFWRRRHVTVDLVTRLFPPRVTRGLDMFGELMSLVFLVICLRYGAEKAWGEYAFGYVSPTIAIPLWVYWVPVIVGLVLSIVGCGVLILDRIIPSSRNA